MRTKVTRTFTGAVLAAVLAAAMLPALQGSSTDANPPDPFDPVRAEQERREAISAQQPRAVDFSGTDLR